MSNFTLSQDLGSVKHLDGVWDKFWKKSQNGTFIACFEIVK